MNWGKGIALSLAAFAAFMAMFMVLGSRQTEELVSREYYAEELRYQERIDAQERARTLSGPVAISVAGDQVLLRFPEELSGKAITGTLTLLRPNDARADRTLAFAADSAGAFRSAPLGLFPGRYDASVEWEAEGVRYHSSEKLVAP